MKKRMSESPIKAVKKLDVGDDRESKTSLDKKKKKQNSAKKPSH